MLERLRRTPVLREMPLGSLDRLASRCEIKAFDAGRALIEGAAKGEQAFVLLSGRVAVQAALLAEEWRTVAERGAGDLVGEMSLIDDLPRSARVIAEGPVTALAVPRAVVLEALAEQPAAALDLARVISVRLRESVAGQVMALQRRCSVLHGGRASGLYLELESLRRAESSATSREGVVGAG